MGVGMVDKVEIEILAVGQGSCNVVKGIDTTQSNKLEYLAILDAGGSKLSQLPAMGVKNKLLDYMKTRAMAYSNVQTDHYADLLLISHSDNDHYCILQSIIKDMYPGILSSYTAKKVSVVVPPKKTSDAQAFQNGEGEDDNFAYVTFSMSPITSGLQTGFLYAYLFQAELCLQPDMYLLRTFNEVTSPAYSELLICGNKRVECSQTGAGGFFVSFNQRFSYFTNTGTFWWNRLSVTNNGYSVDVVIECYNPEQFVLVPSFSYTPAYVSFSIDKGSFQLAPDVINILKFLCQSTVPGWEVIIKTVQDFCQDIAKTLMNISVLYGDSYYGPTTKDSIKDKFKPESGYGAPSVNTISFGEIVTSLSSEKSKGKDEAPLGFLPATIGALVGKSITHTRLRGLREWSLPSATSCQMKITMLGVPDGGADFYMTSYSKIGGKSGNSDSYFRNMNSIITIIEALGVSSHFIFPGDATVHNLWYNKEDPTNGPLLKGSGCNFFILPHHGSVETTRGNVGKDPISVFLHFLEHVDPQYIYISAGEENNHGHPNLWTMQECDTYITAHKPPFNIVDNNVIYYNKVDNKARYYTYCKYPKPLYTTVSAVKEASLGSVSYFKAMPCYRITFEGNTAKHSVFYLSPKDTRIPASNIRDFSTNRKFLDDVKLSASSQSPNSAIIGPLADHPIYGFDFRVKL